TGILGCPGGRPPSDCRVLRVGLHYVGTDLKEAVSVRDGSTAWWVEADGRGGATATRVPTRLL
ncbi:MAG: hypothetical protein ACXVW9_14755, partial [Nocardioidaceae bacterium]